MIYNIFFRELGHIGSITDLSTVNRTPNTHTHRKVESIFTFHEEGGRNKTKRSVWPLIDLSDNSLDSRLTVKQNTTSDTHRRQIPSAALRGGEMCLNARGKPPNCFTPFCFFTLFHGSSFFTLLALFHSLCRTCKTYKYYIK